MVRCPATIRTQEGHIVQCQIYSMEHEIHHVDGYMWKYRDGNPNAFRISPLFLTSGGRIVKPGAGEAACEPEDIMLMTAEELQQGIRCTEFVKRLNAARRKWNMRIGNRARKERV